MDEIVKGIEDEALLKLNKKREDYSASPWLDREFVLAVLSGEDIGYFDDYSELIPDQFWADKEFSVQALSRASMIHDYNLYDEIAERVPEALWNDWHFVSLLVRYDSYALEWASAEACSNKFVIEYALQCEEDKDQNYGYIFYHIPKTLWNDQSFVESYVLYYYDSDSDGDDFDTIVENTPKEFWSEKEFVLEALEKDKRFEDFVPDDLKKDPDVAQLID